MLEKKEDQKFKFKLEIKPLKERNIIIPNPSLKFYNSTIPKISRIVYQEYNITMLASESHFVRV